MTRSKGFYEVRPCRTCNSYRRLQFKPTTLKPDPDLDEIIVRDGVTYRAGRACAACKLKDAVWTAQWKLNKLRDSYTRACEHVRAMDQKYRPKEK